MEYNEKIVNLLTEIRELLRIIAEPQLAERDRQGRATIVKIVGRSQKRKSAVLLIDAVRTRADIQKLSEIDPGDLSRFMSELKEAQLCEEQSRVPRLRVSVDEKMFDQKGEQ